MFSESQLAEIRSLCLKHGVSELYVFGSFLDPARFSKDSDIDFLVEFDWAERSRLSDRFLGLKWDLEALCSRSVDLVCYKAIRNPYFREEVEQTKQLLYAA